MKYKVEEILNTIQGEGVQLGRRCTFIRLSGCNLRCPWCDTKETWSDLDSTKMSIEEIISKCEHNYVVLTGGEPTIQNISPLIKELVNRGYHVGIESNGVNHIPNQDLLYWIAISPKPTMYKVDRDIVPDEVKLVADNFLTKDLVIQMLENHKHAIVLLQPEANTFKDSVQKALRIMEDIDNERLLLGIQAHKFWEVD